MTPKEEKGSAALGLLVIIGFFVMVYGSMQRITFYPNVHGMYRVKSSWWGLQSKTSYMRMWAGEWHIVQGESWEPYDIEQDFPDDTPDNGPDDY